MAHDRDRDPHGLGAYRVKAPDVAMASAIGETMSKDEELYTAEVTGRDIEEGPDPEDDDEDKDP